MVGAGTAGCVVASKLCQKLNDRILLVEADDWAEDFTDVPGLFPLVQNDENMNWSIP